MAETFDIDTELQPLRKAVAGITQTEWIYLSGSLEGPLLVAGDPKETSGFLVTCETFIPGEAESYGGCVLTKKHLQAGLKQFGKRNDPLRVVVEPDAGIVHLMSADKTVTVAGDYFDYQMTGLSEAVVDLPVDIADLLLQASCFVVGDWTDKLHINVHVGDEIDIVASNGHIMYCNTIPADGFQLPADMDGYLAIPESVMELVYKTGTPEILTLQNSGDATRITSPDRSVIFRTTSKLNRLITKEYAFGLLPLGDEEKVDFFDISLNDTHALLGTVQEYKKKHDFLFIKSDKNGIALGNPENETWEPIDATTETNQTFIRSYDTNYLARCLTVMPPTTIMKIPTVEEHYRPALFLEENRIVAISPRKHMRQI